MIVIGMLTKSPPDATNFYRAEGPLAELERSGFCRLLFFSEINWATLKRCDVVFFQRPYSEEHLAIIMTCKDVGVPVWVDYDDWLFEVPESVSCAVTFNNEQVRRSMAACMQLADRISVSTEYLRDCIAGKYGKRLGIDIEKLRVIPNALDSRMFRERPERNRNVILWRGTSTHDADLACFGQQIVRIAHEFAENRAEEDQVDWIFFGAKPWFWELLPPIHRGHISFVDFSQYPRMLAGIRPKAVIVPLCDDNFTRSKSCIAGMEASWAGATTLAPAFDEWQGFDYKHYSCCSEFESKLREICSKSVLECRMEANISFALLRYNRTLEATNESRIAMIEGMIFENCIKQRKNLQLSKGLE